MRFGLKPGINSTQYSARVVKPGMSKNDLHICLAAATILVAVLALSGPKYHDRFSDLGVLILACFPQSDQVQKSSPNHLDDH